MLSIEETLEWIDGQIMVAEIALKVQPVDENATFEEVMLSVSINGRVTTLQQLKAEIMGEKFGTDKPATDITEKPVRREW